MAYSPNINVLTVPCSSQTILLLMCLSHVKALNVPGTYRKKYEQKILTGKCMKTHCFLYRKQKAFSHKCMQLFTLIFLYSHISLTLYDCKIHYSLSIQASITSQTFFFCLEFDFDDLRVFRLSGFIFSLSKKPTL